MIRNVFLFFLASFLACTAWSKTVGLEDVVASSMKHYPQVLEAAIRFEESENRLRAARGEGFDAKIKGDADKRFDGYYDGERFKAQIEKPISYLNSNIYAGYKESDGSFPSYEGKNVTADGLGEGYIGVSLSLIRNSLIDLRRYNVQIAREDFRQSDLNLDQVKIKVQTAAIKAYWTWVVKALELKAFDEILALAKTRQGNITRRVKVGDLAEIFEAENNLYINERIANVRKAQIQYDIASYYLSLFYRNDEGEPVSVERGWIPEVKMKDLERVTFNNALLDRARSQNLKLKVLKSKQKQARAEMKIGNNFLLPKLDLNLEVGQDSGGGTENLQETRAILNFEIPLEFNKGLGKKRAGRLKYDALRTESQLENEKVRVMLDVLLSKINNTQEVIDLTNKQVSLSEQLAKAELRKFTQGSSDLLSLNLREEKLAQSKVKNLEALLKYHNDRAELKEVLVDFLVPDSE